MIGRLRRKFILIATSCVFLIEAVILMCLNGVSYYSTYNECMSILSYIAEYNGRMPDRNPDRNEVSFYVSRELRFETRYFSVIVNPEGDYVASDVEHINGITEADIVDMYEDLLAAGGSRGAMASDGGFFLYQIKTLDRTSLEELALRYDQMDLDDLPVMNGDYRLILFMDCTARFYRLEMIRIFSLVIGLTSMGVFVILISFFSGRAIRPFVENYEKQKQFITNAGHELKTPLAIISANAEVVEAMYEQSEWTESIRHQVTRLTGLVNDLITMAKNDEATELPDSVMESVDISGIMVSSCEDFKTVAAQQEKELVSDIEQKVLVLGKEKMLHELVNILMDNAVKYCDDGGEIKVDLSSRKNKAQIVVSNTFEKPTDCSRFFDRFYRGDTSHSSEKNGYGIGLSMAETIVKTHRGKISAHQKDGRIYMTVTLAISREA